jgi:hypothetical protein
MAVKCDSAPQTGAMMIGDAVFHWPTRPWSLTSIMCVTVHTEARSHRYKEELFSVSDVRAFRFADEPARVASMGFARRIMLVAEALS